MDEMNLIKNNEDFIRKMQEEDPDFFRHLQQGQHPEFFVLACSDSRVSPSAISQMKLGNMFIHRNIANQVSNNDDSFSAGLYYALVHLKVSHIIIKGHTECGGIHAHGMVIMRKSYKHGSLIFEIVCRIERIMKKYRWMSFQK
ncbi:carbonic anhydrase [Cerasibacillus sp. JNUCC 74]